MRIQSMYYVGTSVMTFPAENTFKALPTLGYSVVLSNLHKICLYLFYALLYAVQCLTGKVE